MRPIYSPFTTSLFTAGSGLRLRLHAGVGLAGGFGPALGRRHRRGLGRGRFVDGLAHRRLADEEALDLVAGQGLVFEEAQGELFEIAAMVGEDLAGLRQTGLDQSPDLAVD